MAKNLCYQLVSSIENGFRPGTDKHSEKMQNKETTYKIYSYASRTEMIDFSHRFANFMKTNYPEVKQVKQIGVEHINAYLSAKTNVTNKTMQHEVSCFNKMQLCVNKKFSINVDWKTDRVVPKTEMEKRRTAVFTREQIQGLKDYFDTKRDCYSKAAFFMGERFALRASEVVKVQVRDVHWNENVLHIHDSKGKRSRDIAITEDDKQFLKGLVGDKKGTDRLIPLRADSVCAYLNRACKVLGYDNITQAKTSFHSLRKFSISNYFKEQKELLGEKKAREMAMERLGHSKNRADLYNTYIVRT